MFIQVTLEHFPAEVKSDGTVVVDNTEWFFNCPPPLKKTMDKFENQRGFGNKSKFGRVSE